MQATVNGDAGVMPRREEVITGQTDRHTRARSDAALRDEGRSVPLGCSGFAPCCMCGASSEGPVGQTCCWSCLSCCQSHPHRNLCLRYVAVLSYRRCEREGTQGDGSSSPAGPSPRANRLNQGVQCAGSIRKVLELCLCLEPALIQQPWLGSTSSAHIGMLGASGRARPWARGKSTMHETWGISQKLPLLQKAVTLQLSSTGQRGGLVLQTLLGCFM